MFAYIKDVAHFVVVSSFIGGEGNADIGGRGGCAPAGILTVVLCLLFSLAATPAFLCFARSLFLFLVFVWLKNGLSGLFHGYDRCI